MRIPAIKILVAGHFGAGKTTFVKTASQIRVVETEKKTTLEEERRKKASTTVAMDYGEYISKNGKLVHIFGIPGQERFSFMWPILARNSRLFLILLDSTDTSRWYEAFKQISIFRNQIRDAIFLFVANKRDLPNALPMEEIRKRLKLPPHIKLLESVATDKNSVIGVIEEALAELERIEKEKSQEEEKEIANL